MKKLLVTLLALGSISSMARECHRYNVVPKNERPKNVQHYNPIDVVENYIGFGFASGQELISVLITQKELNIVTYTSVESVSKVFYKGCETQVADLGSGGSWGSILSLSSFKTLRGKAICTYSSASYDQMFVTCIF